MRNAEAILSLIGFLAAFAIVMTPHLIAFQVSASKSENQRLGYTYTQGSPPQ